MSPVWALEKMNFRDPGLTDSNTTVIYEGKFQTIYLQCSRSWNVAEMPLNCLFESKVGSLISEVLQVFLACCWFKMMLVRIELKMVIFQFLKEGWMVSEVRMSARSDLLFSCRSLQSQLNHPASPEKQPKLWNSVSFPFLRRDFLSLWKF